MPTETGTIDLKAQKAGHDDAAKTATNYIGADSMGIRIANANPDTATTYQHQTATETEFVVGGVVVGSFGAKARIGKAGKSRVYIDSKVFAQFDDANQLMMYSHDGAIELGRRQTFVVDGTGFRVYGAKGVESDYVSAKVGSTTTSKQVVKTYPVKSGETLSSVSFPLISPTLDYVRVKSSSGTRELVANTDYIMEGDAAPALTPIDGVSPHSRGAGVEIKFTPAISPTEDVVVEVAYTDGFVDYEMRLGPEKYTHFTVDQDSTRFEATNGSKVQFDYHSLQMVDKEGNTYFHVSDLRDAEGYLTEHFTNDGSLNYEVTNGVDDSGTVTVTVDGVPTTEYERSSRSFTFSEPLESGASIAIRYLPLTQWTKCYTLGMRRSDDPDFGEIGMYSVAEGFNTAASGNYAHAEGYGTTAGNRCAHAEGRVAEAIGLCAHAEGQNTEATGHFSHAQNLGTIAKSRAQTSIGEYNVEDASGTYALIIGNGTSDTARSNAVMVDWDGYLYPCAEKMPDFVVEQGTSGMWTYRKWHSGIMECWGIYTASIAVDAASPGYGGYRSAEITAPAYPFAFTAQPVVSAIICSYSQGAWINNAQNSNAANFKFYLSCGGSLSATSRGISIHAIGRWK